MPAKSYAIKWRKIDTENLKKAVKNFNAKINRILKKNPQAAAYLPDKVKYSELKTGIDTRNEFNRTINSLKRFSRKGAENPIMIGDIVTTQYQRKETAINQGIVNRARAQRLKKLAPSSTKGTMGTIQEQSLQPRSFNWNRRQSDWEKYVKSVWEEAKETYGGAKANQYLQNYLKAIDNNLGTIGAPLKILAQRMGGMRLYEAYAANPSLQIDFIYAPEQALGVIGEMLDAFAEMGVTLTEEEQEFYSYSISNSTFYESDFEYEEY